MSHLFFPPSFCVLPHCVLAWIHQELKLSRRRRHTLIRTKGSPNVTSHIVAKPRRSLMSWHIVFSLDR